MDYFALFELPVGFSIDTGALLKKYRALQQEFHPDTVANASDSIKLNAIRQSALVNDAYQTLSSPVLRADYLLQGQGIDALAERNTQMPLDFLQAQMLVRERLAEATDGETIEHLIEEITAEEQALTQAFAKIYAAHDWPLATSLTRQMQFVAKVKQDANDALDRF